MNALQESRGLVVVDADDYGIPDDLMLDLQLRAIGCADNIKSDNGLSEIGPDSDAEHCELSKIGSDIGRLLGLSFRLAVFSNFFKYKPATNLRVHSDQDDTGGYRVSLSLHGTGFLIRPGCEKELVNPGGLIVQDRGKGVHHGFENNNNHRLSAVWDFEL
jgi:hypothetical protein